MPRSLHVTVVSWLEIEFSVRKSLNGNHFNFAAGPGDEKAQPQVYVSHTEAWEGREDTWKGEPALLESVVKHS